MEKIIIKGAREHNLKGFNLDIPKERLVVITGVSGSGKSSLAFDTIYAEGERRYVESLSAYARQFLEQMDKPDVESIEGLSPAIAIEQKTTGKNPRSTVGTITEVYDYMRLLYARVGTPHCPGCSKAIASQSVGQMCERVMSLPEGTKVMVTAPVVRRRKGEYRKELENFLKQGFLKAVIDGRLVDLEKPPKLDKKKKHIIEIVVDRVVIKDGVRARLAEALETSVGLTGGYAGVLPEGKTKKVKPLFFNERLACADCGINLPEVEPAFFSFNSPHGACPECNGLGEKYFFDADLVVPDKELSLNEGAILPWRKKGAPEPSEWFKQLIPSLAKRYKFSPDVPFKKLSKAARELLLYGSGDEEIRFEYRKGKKSYVFNETFEGVLGNLERRHKESAADDSATEFEGFMNTTACPECGGARLKKEALFVRVGGKSIYEASCLNVDKAIEFFSSLVFEPEKREVARRILKEITERIQFLLQVGLSYLTLDRAAATLSGGEAQRIRLASQIGSSLTGVLYVLDEPSIGLHQRDNARLIAALKKLRDMGNTVIVVEHDEATITEADFVVDMGPGAGELGGEIVTAGTLKDVLSEKNSVTGSYLRGESLIAPPKNRKRPGKKTLSLKGLSANNLKNIDVDIPIGLMTCVTGVSGSGKSTLVIDTLQKQLSRVLYGSKERAGSVGSIKGAEHFDKIIAIDQSPIGRTPRSNPVTYTGVFAPIRELFSSLPDSKARGYKPGRFSFNVSGGRCEPCSGEGVIKVEMHFLPDVYVHCEECNGRRYNAETLDVRYKGKNIAECLDMTVSEALEFFSNIPQVREKLETIVNVGLGYIRLGQPATTLSGGEAQRIKLSKELSRKSTGKTLYILDEPTTGLHFADIKMLLDVLVSLRDAGNTIVIIEHNLDVIKSADYIIDLGPEGGEGGGRVVAKGTPEDIARSRASYTGEFLKKSLAAQGS